MDIPNLSSYFTKANTQIQQQNSLKDTFTKYEERYSDLQQIGEGGQKTIFKAYDHYTGRIVALAFLKGNHEEYFLRESRITAYLQHPYIMPIYDSGLWKDGQSFYSMKFVEGQNLAEALNSERVLTQSDILEIFTKICEAIEFSHAKGVFHLDLKPANIQLSHYGEVLVLDWGLAQISADAIEDDLSILDDELLMQSEIRLSASHKSKGTPGYMAPELQKKSLSAITYSADIYSLGAILYKALCGECYQPERSTPSPSFEALAFSLQAILKKALEKQEHERYQSVESLLLDLKSYQEGFATNAEDAGPRRQLSLLISRNLNFALTLIFFFILLISTLSYFLIQQQQQNRQLKLAIDQYQKEKVGRELALKKSALLYINKMKSSIQSEWNYDKLVEYFAEGRELDPQLKCPQGLQGLMYLAERKIVLAMQAFRAQSNPDYIRQTEKFLTLADENGLLSEKDFTKLIHEFLRRGDLRPALMLIDKDIRDQKDIAKLQKRLLYWFKQRNNKASLKNVPLKIMQKDDGLALSLTNEKRFSNFVVFKNLPLVQLNLSNTLFEQDIYLKDMPLKELILRKTKINSTRPYPWASLEKIDISHTHIRSIIFLSPPQNLKEINLRGCHINNLQVLLDCPQLKTIILTKKHYTKATLQQFIDKGIHITE